MGSLHIQWDVLPVINYALQQNGVDGVKSLTLTNETADDLLDLMLEITAAPEFLMPYSRPVQCVPAGQTVELARDKLQLNGELLSSITERVTGTLQVRVLQGQQVLAQEQVETAVLPFDYWHGTSCYPEMLVSFVTPNHPEIAKIIAKAADYLERWTGDPAMDAYQSQDPNRILSQAGAIFAAIQEMGIVYAVSPASFETLGQRVRLCDTIVQQKMGTCLDLSLFYGACLEAVGLRPLLITTPDHIFTGVWLQEQMFPDSVQDDVSLLTKRLASGVNEIAVVESTCLTQKTSFDEARTAAEQTLVTKELEYILDVHRARLSGVRPLPQRISTPNGFRIERASHVTETAVQAPADLGETVQVNPISQNQELPKKLQWERKLLDLGLRNTLINLRFTKTQLPILATSLENLEDTLSDGSDFRILPKPENWNPKEVSFETMATMEDSGLIDAEFQNKRLRAACPQGELEKSLKNLYRTAKTAMEENGANTLYLALGMLRWYENQRSTKARYAPIILLPVEMVRKSASQGYVIRLRDDDPQMNITLLEKLKQDYGIQVNGLDPLPADEHGVDIRRVLTVMRQAVMEQKFWDVLETACLGIFSFSQFVMWNDIRNRSEDLQNNKIVKSLMDGKLCWEAEPLQMGTRVPEDDVLLPMPADASQLFAIESACEGKSFVLHGPPGTGKSQTITSLIANALAQGKSVLFVAEKMAALEVVQKRLNKIGIGPFCLELHSNKSKKRDVLDQLRQASEVTKTTTAQEFSQRAEQLSQMRKELDGYASQLHRVLPCGKNLYTLIGAYQSCADAPDLPYFDRLFVSNLTGQQLEQQKLVLERMVAAARALGHPAGHPLEQVGAVQYSQSLKGELVPAAQAYIEQTEALAPVAQQLQQAWGQPEITCGQDLSNLLHIAENMEHWYQVPAAWAQKDSSFFRQVGEMAMHFVNAKGRETELLQTFRPEILTQNGEEMFQEFVETSGKWFLAKNIGLSKLTKQLNVFAIQPIEKESLQTHLTALQDYRKERDAADAMLQGLGADMGTLCLGESTDWAQIIRLAEQAQNDETALQKLFGSSDFQKQHCGSTQEQQAVHTFLTGISSYRTAKENFCTLVDFQEKQESDWMQAQAAHCRQIISHGDQLKEWTAFREIATEAENLGLGTVVQAYMQGLSHEDVLPAYEKTMLYGLITDAIDQSPVLNTFSGAVFREKIQQYSRAEEQWRSLSRQEAYCRLAAKVPDFTREAAHSSELGILQRCIKSGGRGVSIRKLFDSIANLLPRLCPCMLMSPISAAQYLDPKREPFDLVVFDEASQLPTCKAVGVLARGKEAVIVGDPKQMPPTSFFASNTADEENLEEEDLESILDDCLALNMPQTHLLWHYRSRHESLIAFSNSRFYENKLLTFPSVNDRASKVQFVPVEGVFDRGKSRCNRAEAQAVVEELRKRAHSGTGQSVGVVTFNVNQQNLIDDLLNEACAHDSAFEKWAYESEEPVFIKNLENVQGDERDVILFSIGYGPDENGKVYMNFGPLNRDGGWRRLNVAVSRARQEMMVFSTLRPEQIDLSRTKSEGVAALRAFLEYAQGRELAVSEAAVSVVRREKYGIAERICRNLEQKGYSTQKSVGRSQYRLDIGVVDPKHPEQYLLGILLDGEAYGAARTTRDRELAQGGVLGGLGWHLMRVWSMDWWDNSQKEMDRIYGELERLQTQPEEIPEPTPEPSPEISPVPAEESPVMPEKKESRVMVPASAPTYRAAEIAGQAISVEAFTEPGNEKRLKERIQKIVDAEAPVSESLLMKHLLQSCKITRAGSRIQNHMAWILDSMGLQMTRQGDVSFYWRNDQNPQSYSEFRVNGTGDCRRDIGDVPTQEIVNAMYLVLQEQFSMTQEDLIRETGKKLGYPRMGDKLTAALERAAAGAYHQGGIQQGTNGMFVLTELGTEKANLVRNHFA